MGATVSVISEELCRPVNASDLPPDVPVNAVDVSRLRELLHIAFKDGENLDDDALTPELAREVNDLLTKCANEPGIARLSNDPELRGMLEEQIEQEDPGENSSPGFVLGGGEWDLEASNSPAKDVSGSGDWGSRSLDWSTNATNQTFDMEMKSSPFSNSRDGGIQSKGGLNRARTQLDLSSSNDAVKRFSVRSLAHMHASALLVEPRSSMLGKSISGTDLDLLASDEPKSSPTPEKDRNKFPPASGNLRGGIGGSFDVSKLRPRAAPNRRGSGVTRLSTVMSQSHYDDDDSPEVKVNSIEPDGVPLSQAPAVVPLAQRGRPVPLSLGASNEDKGEQGPPPAANTQANAGRRRPVPLALSAEPSVGDGVGGGRRRPVPLGLNANAEVQGNDGGGGRYRPAPLDPSITEDADMAKFGDDEENDPLENSCILSKTGTLEYNNFRISTEGIVMSPSSGSGGSSDEQSFEPRQRNSIIDPHAGTQPFLLLQPLGCGASGSVAKSLHMATFQLVAIKTLPIFDAGKRRQMIKELKLLYKWKQDIQTQDDEASR